MPESWRRAFEEFLLRPAPPLLVVLVTVVVLFALGAFVYLAILRGPLEERRLFVRLAADSGLTPQERRALWKVARDVCPDDPIEIFLSPSRWEPGARQRGLPDDLRQSIATKLYR